MERGRGAGLGGGQGGRAWRGAGLVGGQGGARVLGDLDQLRLHEHRCRPTSQKPGRAHRFSMCASLSSLGMRWSESECACLGVEHLSRAPETGRGREHLTSVSPGRIPSPRMLESEPTAHRVKRQPALVRPHASCLCAEWSRLGSRAAHTAGNPRGRGCAAHLVRVRRCGCAARGRHPGRPP